MKEEKRVAMLWPPHRVFSLLYCIPFQGSYKVPRTPILQLRWLESATIVEDVSNSNISPLRGLALRGPSGGTCGGLNAAAGSVYAPQIGYTCKKQKHSTCSNWSALLPKHTSCINICTIKSRPTFSLSILSLSDRLLKSR